MDGTKPLLSSGYVGKALVGFCAQFAPIGFRIFFSECPWLILEPTCCCYGLSIGYAVPSLNAINVELRGFTSHDSIHQMLFAP
jgi:hypothetical protein